MCCYDLIFNHEGCDEFVDVYKIVVLWASNELHGKFGPVLALKLINNIPCLKMSQQKLWEVKWLAPDIVFCLYTVKGRLEHK